MKKVFPIMLISVLLLTFSDCYLMEEGFRVYYHKGTATSGSVPVDSELYDYYGLDYEIQVLGKGTLEKEGYMFLGWKDGESLYHPYSYFTVHYNSNSSYYNYKDINFTAVWNEDLNTAFEFIIEGDEAKITKYKYTGYGNSDVVIPLIYSNKPVFEIADEAFLDKKIYSVNLSRNLKKIGSSAFANCKIYSLVISDSVVSIGINAFENNNIGGKFYDYENNYSASDSYDYKNYYNITYGTITIGTGLTTIPQGAFKKNSIKSLNLPDNIKLIGDEAFAGNKIGQIIIGADVEIESDTSLGDYGTAFKKYYDDGGKQAGEYGYTANFWVKL